MDLVGKAKRVRIYVNEGDRVGHQPAQVAILEWLRAENASGATLLRAIAGFGAAGQLHTAHLVDVAQDLPYVIEWLDAAAVVERLLPRLKEMIPRGLVTVDDTDVVLHQPRPVRALPRLLTAADVMSRDVRAVAPDAPLRDVVERMLDDRHRAVPVVEGGAPVGIVTNGDLVQRGGLAVRLELLGRLDRPEIRETLDRLASHARVAADVMTRDPVTVRADAPLPRVAEVMTRRRLKRLPVVDGQGQLVGVVSRLDLLRTVAGGVDRPEAEPREVGLSADLPLARIMRRDVPTVTVDTPLPQVFQAVIATRLNRALVVDADRFVVGVVTDAELLERVTPALRPGALRALVHRLPFAHPAGPEAGAEQHARARVAADLMSREVPTAPADTRVGDAIGRMLRGGHKLLAVTDASGRLAGVVDRADLLHAIALPGKE